MARRLIVEADGGSRGNPGPAAYGALVRDADTGEILVEIAEHIGTASNNVAEYRGAIAGLTAARDLDPEAQVEVRMDSKLVVEQLSGRWQVKHPDMRVLAKRGARRLAGRRRPLHLGAPRAEQGRRPARQRGARRGGQGPVVDAEPPRGRSPGRSLTNKLVGWANDLGEPTTFRLLRHGETAHSLAKRFSGSGGDDPSLSGRRPGSGRGGCAHRWRPAAASTSW